MATPGEKLKLGNLYSIVRTHANLDWNAEYRRVEVAIKGEPIAGKIVPPLDALFRGTGATRTFTIELLHAALPGVTADLIEAITIERSGHFRESGARFKLAMDLAKQSWFSAQGRVPGEAQLISGVAQSPVVDFKLKAREVIAEEIAVASAEVEGQFDLTGSWDFRRQEILAAPCRGRFGGQRWPAEGGPWRDHDVGQHRSVPSRQQAFFPGGDGSTRGYRRGEASPRGADGRFIGAKSDLTGTGKFEQALVRK